MRLNKNCLNCVFCIRIKEYFISNPIEPKSSKWVKDECTLSSVEINSIKNNDFSFLEEEKRNQEKWIKEYETKEKKEKEKKERYKKRWEERCKNDPLLKRIDGIQSFFELPSLNDRFDLFGSNPYPKADRFNMPEYPNAPENDYLKCWKEQWNFKDGIDKNLKLGKNRCPFYYDCKNKRNKSLNACNEEMERNTRIYETIIYGIPIGIFIGIITWFCTEYLFKGN